MVRKIIVQNHKSYIRYIYRTSMNDQKENELMLNMSPIIKHQIDVEDDNRKFDHDNTYNSCCFRCDKRALQFIVQTMFSAIVIVFCITILLINQDCATFSRYGPLLGLVIGVWLPQPHMNSK